MRALLLLVLWYLPFVTHPSNPPALLCVSTRFNSIPFYCSWCVRRASICLLSFYLFIFSSRRRPTAIAPFHIYSVGAHPVSPSSPSSPPPPPQPQCRKSSVTKRKSWWNGTNGFRTLRLVHIEYHSFRVFHFGYDLLTRNWIVSCSMFMCRRNCVVSFIVGFTVFTLYQIWNYIVYNVWPKRFDYTARGPRTTTTTTTANDKRRIGIAFGRDKNGNQKSTSEKSKYGRHRLALSIIQLNSNNSKNGSSQQRRTAVSVDCVYADWIATALGSRRKKAERTHRQGSREASGQAGYACIEIIIENCNHKSRCEMSMESLR